MRQQFVYHSFGRARAPAIRKPSPAAPALTEVVSEYVAYVAGLTLAVVFAIVTLAFAANITMRWLDAVAKPAYLAQSHPGAGQSENFAMLPASIPATLRE